MYSIGSKIAVFHTIRPLRQSRHGQMCLTRVSCDHTRRLQLAHLTINRSSWCTSTTPSHALSKHNTSHPQRHPDPTPDHNNLPQPSRVLFPRPVVTSPLHTLAPAPPLPNLLALRPLIRLLSPRPHSAARMPSPMAFHRASLDTPSKHQRVVQIHFRPLPLSPKLSRNLHHSTRSPGHSLRSPSSPLKCIHERAHKGQRSHLANKWVPSRWMSGCCGHIYCSWQMLYELCMVGEWRLDVWMPRGC